MAANTYIVRALAWLGPREVEDGLAAVVPHLSTDDLVEVEKAMAAARAIIPAWMAAVQSVYLTSGPIANG